MYLGKEQAGWIEGWLIEPGDEAEAKESSSEAKTLGVQGSGGLGLDWHALLINNFSIPAKREPWISDISAHYSSRKIPDAKIPPHDNSSNP